jgi:exopolysaccharide biosynthesis polyprenyl glycosylphosphotransferase
MFEVERRREKALFAGTDAVAILAAIVLSGFINDLRGTPPCVLCSANRLNIMLTTAALAGLWIVCGRAVGLYEMRSGDWDEVIQVLKTALLTTVAAVSISFILHGEPPRLLAGMVVSSSVLLILAARRSMFWLLGLFRTHPGFATSVVILGFNGFGRYLCDQLNSSSQQYEVVGFLDPDCTDGSHAGRSVLGGIEELPRLAREHQNLELEILLPDASAEVTQRVVELCEANQVRWRMMPPLVRSLASGLTVDHVGVIPLIGRRHSNIQGLNFVLKRNCDIAIASLALIVAAPAMLAAALAVRLFDGSPVLFRQTRIGLYGEPFQLLKFRTMRASGSDTPHQEYVRQWIQNNAPAAGHNGNGVYKLTADPRITRVGRLLRRFSIDELPQLINVLRGDMSLIGPRPALAYELDLYQDWHKSRLAALPGITGLWQVSGRNSLTFEEMVRLDIRYIEDWSLIQDLRIIALTIPALLHGEGH